MAFGQLPMISTAVMIATKTGYLYIIEKNNKLVGMIADTFKKPTMADIQARVKNIQWIKDEALKVIPSNIKAQVEQGYNKMIFAMSNPTTMYTTPARAYANELDKINSLISSVANIPKEKANQIIENAETNLVNETAQTGTQYVEERKSGAISAKKTVVDSPKRGKAEPKKAMSVTAKAGIAALIIGAVFATIGIALKLRGK